MNVIRYWLDASGLPHTEISEWRAVAEGQTGELLSVEAPAVITSPLPDGTEVVLASVAGPAVPLTNYAITGYLDLPLPEGCSLMDFATFEEALATAITEALSVEEEIATYMAGSVAPEVGTMVDKIAAVAQLTDAEKSALTARLS